MENMNSNDMDRIIGVDFDNTIVNYEDIVHRVAVQWGLIQLDVGKNKKNIRDKIRQLPGGEVEWQRLQAVVYGSRMEEARLIDGVQVFFQLCKQYEIRVHIISHKTEFARFDETGANLRVVAMAWMKKNRFFETDGLGLLQESVYFEPSRQEKIERIKYLRCTHFIDDLEEIFFENSFPASVEKILYTPHRQDISRQVISRGARVFTRWEEICDYFFNAKD